MSLILSLAVCLMDAVLPGVHVKSAKSALLVAAGARWHADYRGGSRPRRTH